MNDRPLIEPCRTPERAVAFLSQVCASRQTLWRDDGSPYPLACIVDHYGYVLHFVSIDGRIGHVLSVATIASHQEAAA
jgi:hypothetical protein